jgi:sodium/potassium/calcium exchanger 6
MGMTVEDFLCPSLSSISNILRLSDNVAGVTFLAVGNGAADIFSIIILMIKVDRDGSYAETAMGSILGGGLFVVTVVAGAICFCYKLIVDPSIFIRDVGFYIAAVIWLSVMIADGRILLGEAIGFIILYVLYVVCVLFYNQREKRRQQNSKSRYQLPELQLYSRFSAVCTSMHLNVDLTGNGRATILCYVCVCMCVCVCVSQGITVATK